VLKRVLIANRGEIALRVIRTLREMGIVSVAVFSEADRAAPFVAEADESYLLGPAPAADSYLNVDAILEVARQARVDGIHPGYGFLAENAGFAAAVGEASITFIGPTPESIRLMGDKVVARQTVAGLGVPLVPGTDGPVRSRREALAFAAKVGYPVAVKAAGGGGGRGIRVVESAAEMEEALEGARREALAYFKNPQVYLERYFPDPRHVEIQILADAFGTTVHLGERDCSVQRRHQKLIEETPSPAVDRGLRERMGEAAIRAAQSVRYTSAGTVEFLLTRGGDFYFLEMNTRIQVEHPITEAVTGVDLIREMILIASGERSGATSNVLDPSGHAIEIRVNAEDPTVDFRPTPAPVRTYRPPGGPGVRVDGGVEAGFTIPQQYDSLMAKLIVWAPDRERARRRALRALGEFDIAGPATTIPFSVAVLRHPVFVAGEVGTTFVSNSIEELKAAMPPAPPVGTDAASGTPLRSQHRVFEVEVNRRHFRVNVAELVADAGKSRRSRRASGFAAPPSGNAVVSPMHGTVVAVKRAAGDVVAENDTLFVVEAMKMENEIRAHRGGTLESVNVQAGATVEAGQELAVIT